MTELCECGKTNCVCTTQLLYADTKSTGVKAMTAKTDSQRVVNVNAQAFQLFQKIGLKPPASGQFDPATLDEQLDGQDISTRMAVKPSARRRLTADGQGPGKCICVCRDAARRCLCIAPV
jgi:hypothetical protein